MADSIQEKIVKKIMAALAQITPATGFDNTIASVQRLNQDGVDLAVVPTILVKEGDVTVELGQSIAPMVRRRMELLAVAITRQDETAASLDTRSGGEQVNSLVADIEKVVANNRTWDGLAIQTDPPSYLECEMDAVTPHLARAVRFEVLYEHIRTDPYSQG
jgi:hypothetical protein